MTVPQVPDNRDPFVNADEGGSSISMHHGLTRLKAAGLEPFLQDLRAADYVHGVLSTPPGSAALQSSFYERGPHPYNLRSANASGCGKRGSCGLLNGHRRLANQRRHLPLQLKGAGRNNPTYDPAPTDRQKGRHDLDPESLNQIRAVLNGDPQHLHCFSIRAVLEDAREVTFQEATTSQGRRIEEDKQRLRRSGVLRGLRFLRTR